MTVLAEPPTGLIPPPSPAMPATPPPAPTQQGPGRAAVDIPVSDDGAALQLEQRSPWIAFACYAVAALSLLVSLNTSWRFFERVLHIPTTNGERFIMFAVAEAALVVCGAGMAVNVHRDGRPGAFRTIVWAMCAAMAYMAWAESLPQEAVGRILLGPALGTTMLHLGLGLELRARHQHTSTAARICRELRERCLSRLGLADDGRDAAQRTRDRKAYQAAALTRPRRWPWSRQARLERALLAAGVADDEAMRNRMLARLAIVRHAGALATHFLPSPWETSPCVAAGEAPQEAVGDTAAVDNQDDVDLIALANELRERRLTKRSVDEVVAVLNYTYNHPHRLSSREIGRKTNIDHEAVGRIQRAAHNVLTSEDFAAAIA